MIVKKALFVTGSFDDRGGRPSSYGKKFVTECLTQGSFASYEIYNGGRFEDLEKLAFSEFDTIFWFADVPNDKPKLVREIKKNNPTCMLVTSKRNDDNKYSLLQLVARALQTKSNLLLEFKKNANDKDYISASIFDPLGNCFIKATWHISPLVAVLLQRLDILRGFTRQRSVQIGEAIPFPEKEWKSEFFDLIRHYAQKFHELIPTTTERFLGNISFRCMNGFPSFRYKQLIFVSKRNIDKRGIDQNGFVAVRLPQAGTERNIANYVAYYGDSKPSVDTPIQLALYNAFPRINFMLHSHTYIDGAPTTTRIIPCGALQEIDEVLSVIPPNKNQFSINLLGHGSLCAVENLNMLSNIPYIARPLPEIF